MFSSSSAAAFIFNSFFFVVDRKNAPAGCSFSALSFHCSAASSLCCALVSFYSFLTLRGWTTTLALPSVLTPACFAQTDASHGLVAADVAAVGALVALVGALVALVALVDLVGGPVVTLVAASAAAAAAVAVVVAAVVVVAVVLASCSS